MEKLKNVFLIMLMFFIGLTIFLAAVRVAFWFAMIFMTAVLVAVVVAITKYLR